MEFNNHNHKTPLSEVTRWDILRRSQRESPPRFQKKANYRAKDFKNVDFKDLFENNNFTWSSRVGDYIVTISFEGAFDILQYQLKSMRGKNRWKRITHRMLTEALSKALDTEDLYIDCSCPDFCLEENTLIKLSEGDDITVKDLYSKFNNTDSDIYVYALNDNNEYVESKVTDVWISGYVFNLIEITLDNENTIITTPAHKYLTAEGDYVEAYNLSVGSKLSRNHTVAKIKHIKLNEAVPVYDISVEDYNNFLVSADVILHNCYRFAYWATQADCKYGLQQNTAPKVRNVRNNKGYCCKHILAVLYGKRWVPAAAKCWLDFIRANPDLTEWYIWGTSLKDEEVEEED